MEDLGVKTKEPFVRTAPHSFQCSISTREIFKYIYKARYAANQEARTSNQANG